MKAQVLAGIRQMELREIPQPELKNDTDVLLKVCKVGVCGSDVHYYETGRIGSQIVEFPFIVGHEFSAIVEKTGNGVEKLKVGDEVVVDPAIWCGECEQCRVGRFNTCRNLKFLGCPGQIEGCLCEYIVMPESCCYPTAGAISLELGVLCEPFAIGVYAVEQTRMTKKATAAVLGAGPIGLSCLAAIQAADAEKTYVTDKINDRVDIAKKAGAAWAGNPDEQDIVKEILAKQSEGVDVVYECAGQQDAIDDAVELLKPGGKLMLIGIPREDRISFVIDKLRRKEITVVNVRRQNECTQKAINAVASGATKLDYMITHRFDFEETTEAFDMVAGYKDGVIKAIIDVM